MGGHDQVFKKIIDLANRRDADAIAEFLADDMTFVNPITGSTDKKGMGNLHRTLFEAFPDIHYEVDRTILGEKTIVAECTLTGTHRNMLMNIPPTNKPFRLPTAFVADVEGGKVQKWSTYFDTTTLMRQLGVTK